MKQFYEHTNFRDASLQMVVDVERIMSEYEAQGYRLTLRQLYYQMVARDIIQNNLRSYKNLGELVNNAKLAGLLDWDMIQDRTREFVVRSRWTSPEGIVEACAVQFHMDMWVGQGRRVYVVVEKEALAGVLERVCHTWDVPLLAARGYPSGTVLREFVVRRLVPECTQNARQGALILHLGDHDPSGLDMTRDLEERLQLFADGTGTAPDIELRRIALNMPQILEKNPPPNPAKSTDSRFSEYREEFGSSSWELDALEPQYINALVASHVEAEVDDSIWQDRQREIQDGRDKLEAAAAWLGDQE